MGRSPIQAPFALLAPTLLIALLCVLPGYGGRARRLWEESLSADSVDMEEGEIHTEEFRQRNAFRIACPVIGSMYRRGVLNPDNMGRITKSELKNGLQWLGNSWIGAMFQSIGIAAYRRDDLRQSHRARSPFQERYLNIFQMNPGELEPEHSAFQVQHGVSTNIRDTRFDTDAGLQATENLPTVDRSFVSPYPFSSTLTDVTSEEAARVRQLREQRLNYWFASLDGGVLDDNQRLTFKGIGKLIAKLKTNGDHSSEWSKENQVDFHRGAATTPEYQEAESEWQSLLAFSAFIAMSGRTDVAVENETALNVNLYLTWEDLKKFYLDSQFPEDPDRTFGFLPNDLGLVAKYHEENPSLAFSRLVASDVAVGRGSKMNAFRVMKLFHKVGVDDQAVSLRDALGK